MAADGSTRQTDEPDPELDPELDSDLFDDESWERPARTNRLTLLLVVGLLVVSGFAAGVLVQKHHDAGLLAGGTTRSRPEGGAGAGRSGTAGTPAAVSAPGRANGPGGASPSDAPAAGSGGGAPVVTGTVATVGSDRIIVNGDSGAPVTVLVPTTATVTTTGLTVLRPGAVVSVEGTRGSDGTITASAITTHSWPDRAGARRGGDRAAGIGG
jgi:hypothetical protein